MPKLFELKKFTAEQQRSRIQEVADRTNRKLFINSLVQAAILVVIFTLLTLTIGDSRPNETTESLVQKYLVIYLVAVAVWYLTSLIERAAARRRLKEL